jgi:hypothetical protein
MTQELKEKGKIALSGNSDCCLEECCSLDISPKQEIKEKIKDRYGCCMPEECCGSDASLNKHCCQ